MKSIKTRREKRKASRSRSLTCKNAEQCYQITCVKVVGKIWVAKYKTCPHLAFKLTPRESLIIVIWVLDNLSFANNTASLNKLSFCVVRNLLFSVYKHARRDKITFQELSLSFSTSSL